MFPITDYATVQQCIVRSQQASLELRQPFTFVTMDLAGAKIAYDILWQSPQLYSDVIIHLGAFHAMCSYMGSLGKMMTGSGFEDILIESGVCASGSIAKVMSGKHYNRAMRVHQRMNDAIERLILNKFCSTSSVHVSSEMISFAPLLALAENPSDSSFSEVFSSGECMKMVHDYNRYKDGVRDGLLGKTASFWCMYSDCVWILMRFQQAVKQNDLDMYKLSIRQLCILLFSADHQNYARYLPVYLTELTNLPTSHPGSDQLLRDNGFSVSRSNVPGCRNAIDLTIEQTINRHAKSSGGVIGFSRNVAAYYRWCVTRHKRAEYVESTFDRVDMLPDIDDIHKSSRPAEIKRSETDVNNLVGAFSQFLNPFQIDASDHKSLFCISSGKPATPQIAEDLLSYVTRGDEACKSFIQSRLIDKSTKFQDPMKKLRLKTFQSMAVKRVLTSTQKKTIQVKAERNLLGRLLLLSQENAISLEKLFRYPLGPIPWSIASADGSMVKTDKSKLMHLLEAKSEPSVTLLLEETTYIVDGNAHFQACVGLPDNFEELCLQLFTTLP